MHCCLQDQLKKRRAKRDNLRRTEQKIQAKVVDLRVGISALAKAVKMAKIVLDTAKTAFNKEAKMPERLKSRVSH
jgi:hypothetical protein